MLDLPTTGNHTQNITCTIRLDIALSCSSWVATTAVFFENKHFYGIVRISYLPNLDLHWSSWVCSSSSASTLRWWWCILVIREEKGDLHNLRVSALAWLLQHDHGWLDPGRLKKHYEQNHIVECIQLSMEIIDALFFFSISCLLF